MSPLIAPSLLSANFADLQSDIEMINRSKADWLHLDIMDGVFVPNISFGFPIIEAIVPLCKKPLDVHLMITQPEKFISRLQSLGTYMMNVHYEACLHLHRTVQEIKKAGMKAGITLNPHTPVAMLEDIITDADMILIMSVNPGFGGQKYIEGCTQKIVAIRKAITERNLNVDVEVDGGVNKENARHIIEAGANILVSGSAVFRGEPMENVEYFLNILKEYE